MNLVEITDCTAKYKMLIHRYGGDVWIQIIDKDGNIKYDFLLEMKNNSDSMWNNIEKSFEEIKRYTKERPLQHL